MHEWKRHKYDNDYEIKGGRAGGEYVLPPISNGEITSCAYLACALHYFAGGSPYDIGPLFRISYQDVLLSIWITVNSINIRPKFQISYPESLEAQNQLATSFQCASTPKLATTQEQLMVSSFWH